MIDSSCSFAARCPAGFAPSALILSSNQEGNLKDLQGQLQGQNSSCKLEVAAADATDPQQVWEGARVCFVCRVCGADEHG